MTRAVNQRGAPSWGLTKRHSPQPAPEEVQALSALTLDCPSLGVYSRKMSTLLCSCVSARQFLVVAKDQGQTPSLTSPQDEPGQPAFVAVRAAGSRVCVLVGRP